MAHASGQHSSQHSALGGMRRQSSSSGQRPAPASHARAARPRCRCCCSALSSREESHQASLADARLSAEHHSNQQGAWALAHPGWPVPPPLASPPQTIFNPVALAYLGDAVWELLVRQHAYEQQHAPQARPPRQPPRTASVQRLHTAAASYSNASQQAHFHDLLVQASATHADSEAAPPAPAPSAAPAAAVQGRGDAPASVPGSPPRGATPGRSIDAQLPPAHGMAGGAPQAPLPPLSAEELEVLRWARNSSAVSPPKGVDSMSYKKATALEVLVAHLYLTDPPRCKLVVAALLCSVQQRGSKPRAAAATE